MDDVVQWFSRRVAACVRWSYFTLIGGEETESAGKIERFRRKSVSAEIPPLDCSIFVCMFFVSLYAWDEMSHKSGQLWISSMNRNVASRSSSPCAILESATQITWIERMLLVDSYQHTFANLSHVKYEFTNTKTSVKTLARIEASSICRQQFANFSLPTVFVPFTHTNLSLPTRVCQL